MQQYRPISVAIATDEAVLVLHLQQFGPLESVAPAIAGGLSSVAIATGKVLRVLHMQQLMPGSVAFTTTTLPESVALATPSPLRSVANATVLPSNCCKCHSITAELLLLQQFCVYSPPESPPLPGGQESGRGGLTLYFTICYCMLRNITVLLQSRKTR